MAEQGMRLATIAAVLAGAALLLSGCAIGMSAHADVSVTPTDREVVRDQGPHSDPYMTSDGAKETAAKQAERPH